MSLPISAVNWRAEIWAAHSPGPGEVLGLIQCPCDHGSACPIPRLPLLLHCELPSDRGEGVRQDNLPPLPVSKIQLSFMHSVSLTSTGKYGVASWTPQVSQYLTNWPGEGLRGSAALSLFHPCQVTLLVLVTMLLLVSHGAVSSIIPAAHTP